MFNYNFELIGYLVIILALLFAFAFSEEFVKNSTQYKVLLHRYTHSQIVRFVRILSFIIGCFTTPLIAWWFIKRIIVSFKIQKRGISNV